MPTRGYFTVGRIGRVPVRVHLATPLGLLVFTGGSTNPLLWAGFVLVVLVHELGHALLVRRCRLSMLSIDVNGIGGVCRYAGRPTEVQESIIAWGGVLAQGVLLGIVEVIAWTAGLRGETRVAEVAEMLAAVDVYLMAFNVLPLPPLDGAKAWALFRWRNVRLLGQLGRKSVLKARARAIEEELARLEATSTQRARSHGSDPGMLN